MSSSQAFKQKLKFIIKLSKKKLTFTIFLTQIVNIVGSRAIRAKLIVKIDPNFFGGDFFINHNTFKKRVTFSSSYFMSIHFFIFSKKFRFSSITFFCQATHSLAKEISTQGEEDSTACAVVNQLCSWPVKWSSHYQQPSNDVGICACVTSSGC